MRTVTLKVELLVEQGYNTHEHEHEPEHAHTRTNAHGAHTRVHTHTHVHTHTPTHHCACACVLAYRVLRGTNLSPQHQTLTRATYDIKKPTKTICF